MMKFIKAHVVELAIGVAVGIAVGAVKFKGTNVSGFLRSKVGV